MFIKDIRKFREFYKTNIIEISENNRNPHFAGDIREGDFREFGFFHMFNGHGDIENKLTTVLNIAGDSQAIYEFMQNAVDANSKNFFLSKFGEDNDPYLVVLNDGEYFSLQSIISILAIGASSKYRNPDNIGQFGVGFKLAHRLIGSDNSLKEILDENKGPLLFSWANRELVDLPSLADINYTDPELYGHGKNAYSQNLAPWLFKIIGTNFPCFINDTVLDVRGRLSNSLITEKELEVLKNSAKMCLEQCTEASNFKSGTLLVIPLHPAKVEHVIGKIPKGLEVAATIISRRGNREKDLRTQIGKNELKSEELFNEHFTLNEEYIIGNLESEKVNQVEIMLLYSNPFKANPFKGKPQFYRFFPMALEQHGFRFAVHSNALTLSSARTELQENDSNKFILTSLANLIKNRLLKYSDENVMRFENLYATLLLSNRGEGSREWMQGRQWLEVAFWQPILSILSQTIPIFKDGRVILLENNEHVIIKNSNLPLQDWYKVNLGGWFLWNEKTNFNICFEAKEKLKLKSVNLIDVISEKSNIESINKWLSISSSNATSFFEELNEIEFESIDRTSIMANIFLLKLWWFNNQVYSLENLATQETLKFYLLNYGPLSAVKQRLEKVDIITSFHCLDKYPVIAKAIRESAQKQLPYLFNYEELNKLLSLRFSSNHNLNIDDKKAIFISIETAVRNSASFAARRIEIMKHLAIFTNLREEVKSLRQLTSLVKLPSMLQNWTINKSETIDLNLNEYLSNSLESVYEFIIRPHWNDIVTQPYQTSDCLIELFTYVKECYTLKPAMGSFRPEEVFFGNICTNKINFYHQTILEIESKDYDILANYLGIKGYCLPNRSLLNFYNEAPFLLPANDAIDSKVLYGPLIIEEARVLIRWLGKSFPEVLDSLILFDEVNESIIIKSKNERCLNYFTESAEINNYIKVYLSDILIPLPVSLADIKSSSVLQNDELIDRLIHEHKIKPNSIKYLTTIVASYGNDNSKRKLLSMVESFDPKLQIQVNGYELDLLKLCFTINNENLRREVLMNLIYLDYNGNKTLLKDISNKGSDILTIQHSKLGPLQFSINQILGGEATVVNRELTMVAKYWQEIGLATADQIDSTIGIEMQRKVEDVWQLLNKQLDNGKIQNGYQLAFLWAYSEQVNIDYSIFKVETKSGWNKLEGVFYLCNKSFIPDEMSLGIQYRNLSEIIHIDNNQILWDKFQLLYSPFLKGESLIIPGIERIEDEHKSEFRKYLYDIWCSSDSHSFIKIDLQGQHWDKLIGYYPRKLIISENCALSEEMIPREVLIQDGIAVEKINFFMDSLGAQNDTSAIVQTRMFFLKDGGRLDTGMNSDEIVSTLKWLFKRAIIVEWNDIAPFYRNLAGKNINLEYFPAYIPDTYGLKVISIESEVYHIGKDALQKAKDHQISIGDICNLIKCPLINIANLQDWGKHLFQNTNLLKINWNEPDWVSIKKEALEWQFPFYEQWKLRYPNFVILSLPGGEVPRRIVINDKPIKSFRSGKIIISEDFRSLYVGGADIETLVNQIEDLEEFSLDAKKHLRQCFDAQAAQFDEFIDLAKKDLDFAKLLKDRAEVIRIKEERTAKAEVVKDAESRYTVSWFLNLLDLVKTQEKSVNIPEAIFSKCERLSIAEKVYQLSECNGRIPSNIESFDEIPAEITYMDTNGQTNVRTTNLIASEKHQKLWVMFPELAIQANLEAAVRIISVKLLFTRTIDLIEELKGGFRRLQLSEDTNLKDTLSDKIDFIFGPPGTGKTTELASGIIECINSGDIGPRVVLTPTNKAADVLTKKIIEKAGGIAPKWLIRAGICTDPDLLKAGVVRPIDEYVIEESNNNVVVTTIHRFAYFTVSVSKSNTDKSRLCDCPWTEVVFDEASMIPLAYIIHAIQARQRAKPETHFLVAGDPLQIPPVFDLDNEDLEDFADQIQEENIYKMIGLTSFDEADQRHIPIYGNHIRNLKIQHRSIPSIGNIFSQFQYKGILESSRGTTNNPKSALSRLLPNSFLDLGINPVTIIRYPVKSGDSIYKPGKLNGSPIHLHSALLVSEIIKYFRQEITDQIEKEWSIGVLSPYRSQADLMAKMIEAHTKNSSNLTITTDTVHGFQGDENDIIFAVFNPSGYGGDISCSRFLKKEYIINVAISRAQDYLIMLIPDDDSNGISALPLLQQLIQLANNTNPQLLAILDSAELEFKLKGKRNYFEENSFSTAHQKVNIYGKPELPFMIRMNGNSLDVHWEV